MSKLTHYVDIRPAKPAILYELYGRVMMATHLAIAGGYDLAVDWPQWQEGEGRFGFVMRVLGEAEGLFAVVKKLAGLIENKLIDCGELKRVPPNADPRWMFVRDRQAQRTTPSYARRLERRAAARGESVAPISKVGTPTHWLPMQSFSNKQSFRLDIKRVPALHDTTPNAYGLSVAIPDFEA